MNGRGYGRGRATRPEADVPGPRAPQSDDHELGSRPRAGDESASVEIVAAWSPMMLLVGSRPPLHRRVLRGDRAGDVTRSHPRAGRVRGAILRRYVDVPHPDQPRQDPRGARRPVCPRVLVLAAGRHPRGRSRPVATPPVRPSAPLPVETLGARAQDELVAVFRTFRRGPAETSGALGPPVDLVLSRLRQRLDHQQVDVDVRRPGHAPRDAVGDVLGGERGVDPLVNLGRAGCVAAEASE